MTVTVYMYVYLFALMQNIIHLLVLDVAGFKLARI